MKAFALALLLVLAACGGGDPEDFAEDPPKGPPVNCEERPEACA